STYTSDNTGAYHFVGLTNFGTLLTDSLWSKPFWNAAKNNLIFFLVHMAVQNPIGIALAGLLSLPGLKLKGLYRTLIFLPTMLSVVIVGARNAGAHFRLAVRRHSTDADLRGAA